MASARHSDERENNFAKRCDAALAGAVRDHARLNRERALHACLRTKLDQKEQQAPVLATACAVFVLRYPEDLCTTVVTCQKRELGQ